MFVKGRKRNMICRVYVGQLKEGKKVHFDWLQLQGCGDNSAHVFWKSMMDRSCKFSQQALSHANLLP